VAGTRPVYFSYQGHRRRAAVWWPRN